MADKPVNTHYFSNHLATSGQPDRAQIHGIADEGYEALVNLAMHDSENAIPDEGSLAASLGMVYVNIPVPFDEPTVEHLREFIGIMDSLAHKKVWVHCAVNARVSAFMYHYLTKTRGYSDEAAASPLMQKWRPKMDDVWEEFMGITNDEVATR
jgi:protein tyrosine phosphatase (PTP) superfamily phosphohydrolase (DUF442 family)